MHRSAGQFVPAPVCGTTRHPPSATRRTTPDMHVYTDCLSTGAVTWWLVYTICSLAYLLRFPKGVHESAVSIPFAHLATGPESCCLRLEPRLFSFILPLFVPCCAMLLVAIPAFLVPAPTCARYSSLLSTFCPGANWPATCRSPGPPVSAWGWPRFLGNDDTALSSACPRPSAAQDPRAAPWRVCAPCSTASVPTR